MIHWHCGWPREACPCPQDEVTAQARWAEVRRRHRAAVALFHVNEKRRQARVERQRRRAS